MAGKNRRDFLRIAGAGLGGYSLLASPAAMLLEAMTRGLFGRAFAQGSGLSPRNWVDFRLDGAPPRWLFDLFLTPYDKQNTFVSGGFGTRYVETDGRYTAVEYKTYKFPGTTLNLPWLWQFPVPASNGNTRSMQPLLANMLHVRGIYVGNPDHAAARSLHFRPLGARQSVSALAADSANFPIPAVFAAVNNYQFASIESKSPLAVATSNYIQSLMTPFSPAGSPTFKTQRLALDAYIDAAQAAMSAELRARNIRHEPSIGSRAGARNLMETAFGDLGTVWDTLFSKYEALCLRAYDPTVVLAGINDRPIGVTTSRAALGQYEFNNVVVGNSDIRSMVTLPAKGINGTRHNLAMARAFALAEFVLTRGLSNSISVGIGAAERLIVNDAEVAHNVDEHFTGNMISTLVNTYSARALAACLLEFFDVLKATKGGQLFDDTVINVSGEFNRRPRLDGSGSDHNWEGGNLTMYSGSINGPHVLGNIRASTGEPNYPGTWGFGAPISELSNQILDLTHTTATIATMLKVPSPLTVGSSVVEENSSGIIVPTISTGKNL